MNESFNSDSGLILVSVCIEGHNGVGNVILALDTGATSTILSTEILSALGYDPALPPERREVTTGSGIEMCAVVHVTRLSALGKTATEFEVLCHTLPPSAQVDGLLGLDFFRQTRLTLDFQNGQIVLNQ